jgi:hypothetical protein
MACHLATKDVDNVRCLGKPGNGTTSARSEELLACDIPKMAIISKDDVVVHAPLFGSRLNLHARPSRQFQRRQRMSRSTSNADNVPRHIQILRDKYSVVFGRWCARRIWERQFSAAEREQLGGTLERALEQFGNTIEIWRQVRGGSPERAVADLAFRIDLLSATDYQWILRELGQESDDTEAVIQQAIAAGGLVLVERPRAAYWAGDPIDVDWERRSALWNYFCELVDHSKAGRVFDGAALREIPAPGELAKQKHRLSKEVGFPASLTALIVPAGLGSQRIDLPPTRIRIFRLTSIERLLEVGCRG